MLHRFDTGQRTCRCGQKVVQPREEGLRFGGPYVGRRPKQPKRQLPNF